jgi:hypothetical protein
MINFKVSDEDMDMIENIAERAHKTIYKDFPQQTFADTIMDLCATHNHCPLKLYDLWLAPKFDFDHDVLEIRTNLNRKTGVLENCFLPRYAKL